MISFEASSEKVHDSLHELHVVDQLFFFRAIVLD